MGRLARCEPCNAAGQTQLARKRITRRHQKSMLMLVSGGMTLIEAAAKECVDVPDLMQWILRDDKFAQELASARKLFVDVSVDRLHDVALELVEQTRLGLPVSKQQIAAVKTYGDVVKWTAERIHRDKYSAQIKHDIIGLAAAETTVHTVWVDP